MLRFYFLRVIKDYLGHIILLGLPTLLIFINMQIQMNVDPDVDKGGAALYVGFVFILMFQAFGAAYTFEGIEQDFFTPFKDRLRAAPVRPVWFLITNMVYGMLISFLQLLVVLTFVVLMYDATISNWGVVVAVLFMGVMFTHTFASLLIVLLKKANKAQTFITLYAIGGTMIAGMFFPLPENALTEFLSRYSSPITWQWISIEGFMANDYSDAFLGLSLLLAAFAIVMVLFVRLSKRVVA